MHTCRKNMHLAYRRINERNLPSIDNRQEMNIKLMATVIPQHEMTSASTFDYRITKLDTRDEERI